MGPWGGVWGEVGACGEMCPWFEIGPCSKICP
jgi:hypothetical protein